MLNGTTTNISSGMAAIAAAMNADTGSGPSDDLPEVETLGPWTVDVQRAIYETVLVTVEAANEREACIKALDHVSEFDGLAAQSIEASAQNAPFIAALGRGDADPWGINGSRAPVPVAFAEHGAGGVGREPKEVKHAAIYHAMNAWAKDKGLSRFGATLDEFRMSMSEFVRDLRALCVDAGHPFGDVLHDSGLDGACSPFVIEVQDGNAGLCVAHRDLEGMFYGKVDFDTEGADPADYRRVTVRGVERTAFVRFDQAATLEIDIHKLEAGGQ